MAIFSPPPVRSFFRRNTNSQVQADTSSSAPDFETWLFTKAETEHGPFPDWPYLREYAKALSEGRDLTVLKRRQILISWVTAAYFHFTASRNPFHHCAVISAGKVASAKQGRRIVQVARRDGYDVRGVDLIKYPNGSEITVFPSTEHAGVGESLKVLHMDEFDFHPYARQNLNTIRPAVANSKGQILITSTSNPELGASGPFVDLWGETPRANRLFYGRDVRPDQGEEFFAEERRKPGMTAEVFSAYYPETEEDAFISRSGLVFGTGSDGVLIFDPRLNVVARPPFTWKEAKWRVAGIDPGGRDPSGITVMGVSEDERQCVFSEQLWRGMVPASAYAEYLQAIHEEAPFDVIVVDPSAASLIATLKGDYGLPCYPANNDRAFGITVTQDAFRSRRLVILEDCEELIYQLGTYWFDQRKEGSTSNVTFATKTPASHHADLIDPTRYECVAVYEGFPRITGPVRLEMAWK